MVTRNERKLEVRITSEARQFDRGFQQAQRSVQGFSKQMNQASKTGVQKFNGDIDIARQRLKAFIGVASAAALLHFAGGLRESANALGESVNAVNVIFEEGAGQVLKFGENAAESVGLAESAFNQLVVPIGSMLRNFGFDAEAAADGAIELAQRAADMASVFNVDVTEALSAVQAALRGESDPIERFGASISAARVEAFLLAEGLVASKAEITDSDKVMGRYKLILADTARVQGDFANTSEENANATRIFQARLEDLKASAGQAIIPLFNDLLSTGNDLIPTLETLGTDVMPVLVDILGDFIAGVADLVERFSALPDLVKIATGALLGLYGVFKLLSAHPLVAGIGLIVAAIVAIGDAARDEKIQVEELRVAIEDLAATGEDTDLRSAIREDLLGLLADSDDAAEAIKNLGLSLEDLVSFSIGDPVGVRKVTDAIDDYRASRIALFEEGKISNTQLAFDIGAVSDLHSLEDILRVVSDRYRETAESVEEERAADARLRNQLAGSELDDHVAQTEALAEARKKSARGSELSAEEAAEEQARLEDLNTAVGNLAVSYQEDLAGAVQDYLDIFEEAEKVDPKDVASPDDLVANAEARLDRIRRFLSGLERLREEGLTDLVFEFQAEGLTGESLGELEGLVKDIDEGGAAAFELNELVAAGEDEISRLTASMAAKLANEKAPVLAEAQQLGVDIGQAVADGLGSVQFEISLRSRVSVGGGDGPRTGPTDDFTPRAHGGRVNPQGAYLVGDGGRTEVLQMGANSGFVHPSIGDFFGSMIRQGSVSGGAGTTVNLGGVHVDARGATDPEKVAYATRRVVSRELRNFEAGQNRRI